MGDLYLRLQLIAPSRGILTNLAFTSLLTIHAAKETAAPHERTSEAGRVAA